MCQQYCLTAQRFCITSANLHVRNFRDCQHPADEKSRQHIVVTHSFSKPYLHLQTSINTPLDDSKGGFIQLRKSSHLDEIVLGRGMLSTVGVQRHAKNLQNFGLYIEHVDMLQTAANVVYHDSSVVE